MQLMPSLNKILKALIPQAVVKVGNISDFQRRGLLLFGFLQGSFSGLAVVFHSEYGLFYPIQPGHIKDKLPLKAGR